MHARIVPSAYGSMYVPSSIAASTRACQPRPPSYDISNNYTSVNSNTQAIVPQYEFSCHGKVTSWVVCTAGAGSRLSMQLQVWRPVGELGNYYSMAGYNERTIDSNNDNCASLEVADSDQVTVWPGDVVGFYVQRSGRDERTILIQEESSNNVTVYYDILRNKRGIREHYAIGEGSERSPSSESTGELTQSLIGAPLISAIVGKPDYHNCAHTICKHIYKNTYM